MPMIEETDRFWVVFAAGEFWIVFAAVEIFGDGVGKGVGNGVGDGVGNPTQVTLPLLQPQRSLVSWMRLGTKPNWMDPQDWYFQNWMKIFCIFAIRATTA